MPRWLNLQLTCGSKPSRSWRWAGWYGSGTGFALVRQVRGLCGGGAGSAEGGVLGAEC